MSTTCLACLSLLFLLLCLHGVSSEKLQFLNIPQRREILTVGANLTINCTTNNQTAETAVHYRRRIKSFKWKKIEAIPGKVIHQGSVYTLLGMTRNNKGQYQCRAWESTNSTVIKWPDNVGVVLVRGGLEKGSRKPDSKVQGNKKQGHKKLRHKKTKRKKAGPKQVRHKKRRPKKPGNQKPTKERDSRKRQGAKRGGTKRPGRKQTGTKKAGMKQGPKLKVLNDTVTITEGSLAVLKCTAQLQGGKQLIISWYRANKLIGCSKKRNFRCSSVRRYLITYKIRTTRGGNRKKLTSYLRIPKAKHARDHNTYLCVARDKQGSTRKAIRLKIKKRSS